MGLCMGILAALPTAKRVKEDESPSLCLNFLRLTVRGAASNSVERIANGIELSCLGSREFR